MDTRHALGGVQSILRCHTYITAFEILSNVEDRHVLSRYPLVSPCEPPFPHVRDPAATANFRCPRHYPYRHQGTRELCYPGLGYSNRVSSDLSSFALEVSHFSHQLSTLIRDGLLCVVGFYLIILVGD